MKTPAPVLSGLLLVATVSLAQTAPRVGVGTTTPRAGLDVSHNDGLLATGTFDAGTTDHLPTGAGTRLLWIPKKAAFRVGHADGATWNYANVGAYSTATGRSTTASGYCSTAMGNGTTASGDGSTALGDDITASGTYATAIGRNILASGEASTAIGHVVRADGEGATTLGYFGLAQGSAATALGGGYAYARCTAIGQYGMAVVRNGVGGSFTFTDGSETDLYVVNNVSNQFNARFNGGYRLFTNPAMTVGVSLAAGGNAWQTISDSTKKEGFRSADGASFLRKIAGMRLGSWNYRGQDARTMRHYGPMAQDFFAAFGRDGGGTIGTDTTLNGADFDGINLIAIQALVRENHDLNARLVRLEAERRRARAVRATLLPLLERLNARLSAHETTPLVR